MIDFKGKHLLLVVENLSVPFDKRVWRQATALKATGAAVSVICPMHDNYTQKHQLLEGINIYRYQIKFSKGSKLGYLREYTFSFLKIFLMINKLILTKKRMRSVHFANPPDIFWVMGLYLKLFGIKFIFDEHDLTPETYISRFQAKTKKGLYYHGLRLFQYLSYMVADTIILTNESYKENACSIYPPAKNKSFIVRNGPDIDKFYLTDPDHSLKKNKKFLFAYIGIMAIQDGVDFIIHSAYCLIHYKKFKDFIIYLIGSGDDVARLKQLVKIYRLEDYVIFTGRISDADAMTILSTADICLSPDPFNALNNRSTMNKVMEYMTMAKPIVSFDLKEAKYSAMDSALYVENNDIEAFANGILNLVANPEEREKMGKFGYRRVQQYLSWQNQISNLISAYTFTINNHKSKQPYIISEKPIKEKSINYID